MSNDVDKFIGRSRTVFFAALAAMPTILPQLGISFGVDDQKLISGAGDAIFTALSSLSACYFRYVAKANLRLKVKK